MRKAAEHAMECSESLYTDSDARDRQHQEIRGAPIRRAEFYGDEFYGICTIFSLKDLPFCGIPSNRRSSYGQWLYVVCCLLLLPLAKRSTTIFALNNLRDQR